MPSPASVVSNSPPNASRQGSPFPGQPFHSISSSLEPQAHPAAQHRGPDPPSLPQSREPAPGRILRGRGQLVSSKPKLHGPRVDPPLCPFPVRRSPRYHSDPCPDPRGPGPAVTGRLRLCLQLWGPGLQLTSGRRTRLPPHARPSGSCSLNACVGT